MVSFVRSRSVLVCRIGGVTGQIHGRVCEGYRQGKLRSLLHLDHFDEGAALFEGGLVLLQQEGLQGAAAGAEHGRIKRGLDPHVPGGLCSLDCGRLGRRRHGAGGSRCSCRGGSLLLARLGLGLCRFLLLGLQVFREKILVDKDDEERKENRQKCPDVRAHGMPPGARLPDRIVAAGVKRVTPHQAPDPEIDPSGPGRTGRIAVRVYSEQVGWKRQLRGRMGEIRIWYARMRAMDSV